ncbi:MAG: cyanophycinase, partial [Chloroflexota bacterium]
AAVANAYNGKVKILVLPIAYASNPENITETERRDDLKLADIRRVEIQDACTQAGGPQITCEAILAPILVRSDALNQAILDQFTNDLSAVFILGGDQATAMQVIAGTPVEQAMAALYRKGLIIAGTSAGAAVQSTTMLAGLNPGYTEASGLNFGAVDLWNSADKHGLSFGIRNAIVEQHFYQRGRFGRLLNAISLPGVPHVGVGIDASSGVHVFNGSRLEKAFGLYTVTILDAETYHSAEGMHYRSCEAPVDCAPTMSLRNVLVHLLSPGDFWYDLTIRKHSLGAPAAPLERSFETLSLPQGAGPLILGGDLSTSVEDSPVLSRFVELSGGEQARILVIAAAFSTDVSSQRIADRIAEALGVTTKTQIITRNATEAVRLRESYSGIILVARDQSKIKPELLKPVKDAWLAGLPVLVDNAAAAVVGAYYSAHGPTPLEGVQAEIAAQKSFLEGYTQVKPGLGMLDITIEPQVLSNNRWGRLFSLAYTHPDLLTIGLNRGMALELTREGARVIGDNALLVLDLRSALRSLGTNRGFVIANGLLDVFAGDESVIPQMAGDDARSPAPLVLSTTPAGDSQPSTLLDSTANAEATAPSLDPGIPAPAGQQDGIGAAVAIPALLGVFLLVGLFVYRAQRRRA